MLTLDLPVAGGGPAPYTLHDPRPLTPPGRAPFTRVALAAVHVVPIRSPISIPPDAPGEGVSTTSRGHHEDGVAVHLAGVNDVASRCRLQGMKLFSARDAKVGFPPWDRHQPRTIRFRKREPAFPHRRRIPNVERPAGIPFEQDHQSFPACIHPGVHLRCRVDPSAPRRVRAASGAARMQCRRTGCGLSGARRRFPA